VTTEVRVVDPKTGGEKGSKLARFDLLPPGPLHAVAELYGVGAQKYAERNWEKGYDWGLSFAALNRHLWAMWNGEWIDEETGSPHLAAVVFHAFALMEFHDKGLGTDSRSSSRTVAMPFAAQVPEESFIEWQRRLYQQATMTYDTRHHLELDVNDGDTIEVKHEGYRVNLGDWHEWEDHGGEG
jgi:hypothetical protein